MDREAHISDGQLQYIARISHGKDSLKMLDVIFTRGLPLDRITTTDVWATDTIRGEHPRMVEFKTRADEYIWRKYHIEVEHLCATRNGEKVTYEKMFYHVPKRKPKKCGGGALQPGDDQGLPRPLEQVVPSRPQARSNRAARRASPPSEGAGAKSSKSTTSPKVRIHKSWFSADSIKGFPVSFTRKGTWCTHLKTRFLDGPTARGGKNIVEYLGIAADEPKRFGQLNDRKRAPLVEFGIEEGLCGLHCQYEGILGPAYDTGCRDGCWFCRNQGVNQLRLLRRDYPELWALLLKWDVDSPVNFHADGHTVHDFDKRFQMEDEHLVDPQARWLWEYLDAELNYRMF